MMEELTIEEDKFELIKTVRVALMKIKAMEALYQKDKAVLSQKVQQMQYQMNLAKQRELKLKESYRLLLGMLKSGPRSTDPALTEFLLNQLKNSHMSTGSHNELLSSTEMFSEFSQSISSINVSDFVDFLAKFWGFFGFSLRWVPGCLTAFWGFFGQGSRLAFKFTLEINLIWPRWQFLTFLPRPQSGVFEVPCEDSLDRFWSLRTQNHSRDPPKKFFR